MATQAEIRQRVFDYLYGTFPTESPFATTIVESYTNSETTIDIFEEDNWAPQDILENPGTGEQMLVTVVTTNDSDDLTVIRAFNGTAAAASAGTSDTVYKNPRFTVKKVDDAIASVIASLELWGIHVFGNGSITRADPKEFYELSETDIVDHLGVLKLWEVDENYEQPRALPFRWQFSLGTTPSEYATTGHGIHVLDWGTLNDAEDAYFTYAKEIDAVTDLLTRQEELVVVGAAALLVGGTIVPATHDPGARTDRTTQPGQTSRDVRYFQGRFITEARLEAANLSAERSRMIQESPKLARARRWRS